MNLPPPSPKQARIIWLAVTALAIGVIVALVGALFWGLGKFLNLLSPVLWPLAIAGVIAYLLDPVVDYLVKKRVKRTRAILLVFTLGVLMVAGFFAAVVPRLVTETGELVARVPRYSQHLRENVAAWISRKPALRLEGFLPFLRASQPTTNAVVNVSTNSTGAAPGTNQIATVTAPPGTGWEKKIIESVASGLADVMPQAGAWILEQLRRAASWLGVLVGLGLVPVYAFYFLQEKRGISDKWTEYLPVHNSRFKEELVFVLTAINDYLITFFRGQVLVAICDGVLYTIGFLAIGLHGAFLIGVMATVLTMIPFVGAMITCVTALVLAAVQFQDWPHPALVLVVFGVVQGLEGLVISPRIMGDRVGLHPLAIIIAVMAGTTLLGGILGGILAIPLAAALRVVMFRYVWKPR